MTPAMPDSARLHGLVRQPAGTRPARVQARKPRIRLIRSPSRKPAPDSSARHLHQTGAPAIGTGPVRAQARTALLHQLPEQAGQARHAATATAAENVVERGFRDLDQWRRFATRYGRITDRAVAVLRATVIRSACSPDTP
jgi:hypothetical protein